MWTCGIQIKATSENVCHPQYVPCIPIEVCLPTEVIAEPEVEIDLDISYQEYPSKVLDCKESSTRAKLIKMYKIQWSNHSEEEATWKIEEFLRSNYPDCLPKGIGT
jgi:hypothetical protein